MVKNLTYIFIFTWMVYHICNTLSYLPLYRNRVTNVDIIAYETADNIKSLLDTWNMNTNKWLKNYVYLRVTPPGKNPNFFSTIATFGTSAIWHGFYPGYYCKHISK